MIHVYYGDGKGKTTAALGLALRALGHKKSVCIVQFLKGMPTGELSILSDAGVNILRCDTCKFIYKMTDEEKAELKKRHDENLAHAFESCPDLLILDEAIDALSCGVLSEDLLRRVIFQKPENTELVLTGHVKIDWIFEAADYITNMQKEKHPFDRGVPARKGVEF